MDINEMKSHLSSFCFVQLYISPPLSCMYVHNDLSGMKMLIIMENYDDDNILLRISHNYFFICINGCLCNVLTFAFLKRLWFTDLDNTSYNS